MFEPYLHAREELLSGQIQGAIQKVSPLGFVAVEHPSDRSWIVRVPLYTDIEDRSFLDAFRSGVENEWHLVEGADEFRVAVDLRDVPAPALYPEGGRPARGQHIDVARHVDRFLRHINRFLGRFLGGNANQAMLQRGLGKRLDALRALGRTQLLATFDHHHLVLGPGRCR